MKYILVCSGKGGVGKTTISLGLSEALRRKGLKVGLLDLDLESPTLPKMLGVKKGVEIDERSGLLKPPEHSGIRVMSIAFIQPDDVPLIWFDNLKIDFVGQLIKSVNWEDTEIVVVDMPPGTGDEFRAAMIHLKPIVGAVIVTIPDYAAVFSAVKVSNFLKEFNVKILGVVENFSEGPNGVKIFQGGDGEKLAEKIGTKLLFRVPFMADRKKLIDFIAKKFLEVDLGV